MVEMTQHVLLEHFTETCLRRRKRRKRRGGGSLVCNGQL